jgi:FtsP/CotA-like multicopper oxidase with cupredoxin domain
VLTRGQPAEIEVVNSLKDPTAIQWHGIELESFYDGVPGFTGDSRQTTPPIAPGGSFVARMTPPRAGTFIYHTHWHDDRQIQNGVYGPLIVLEPGQKYDPDHDKVFLFSSTKFPDPFGLLLLINGNPEPWQIRLRAGEKYRFRLINITGDAVSMRVSLLEAGQPVQWNKVAKDGADLPAALAVAASAREVLTVGETRDFEYQSPSPAELQLEAMLPISGRRVVLALVFEGGK